MSTTQYYFEKTKWEKKEKQEEMREDLMQYLLSDPVLIGNTITTIKGPAIIILFITDRNRMKICPLKWWFFKVLEFFGTWLGVLSYLDLMLEKILEEIKKMV